MKPSERVPKPIHIACPKCEAPPMFSCCRRESNGPRTGATIASFHSERVQAARLERMRAGTDVSS